MQFNCVKKRVEQGVGSDRTCLYDNTNAICSYTTKIVCCNSIINFGDPLLKSKQLIKESSVFVSTASRKRVQPGVFTDHIGG